MTIDQILNPAQPTPAERKAALGIVLTVAEAIRELGSVPSGHLYARLIGMPLLSQMTADQFTAMIGSLKGAGLVEEKSHLLIWIGPRLVPKRRARTQTFPIPYRDSTTYGRRRHDDTTRSRED